MEGDRGGKVTDSSSVSGPTRPESGPAESTAVPARPSTPNNASPFTGRDDDRTGGADLEAAAPVLTRQCSGHTGTRAGFS